METYGYDKWGKCWSNYLKKCLSNKTVLFDELLGLSVIQKENALKRLEEAVDVQLKQGCLANATHTTVMKHDALSLTAFPPVPVKKVSKRRTKYRKKQKLNDSKVTTISESMQAITHKASLTVAEFETMV